MKSKFLVIVLAIFLCVMTVMPLNAYASYSGGETTPTTLDIQYEERYISEMSMDYSVPPYDSIQFTNSCAPVAGSCIVGYYDRIYENLLPDHTNYYIVNGVFYYAGQGQVINNMTASLYSLMQTNVNGNGTSEANFKSGLSSFVNSRGYNITYTSIMSNGNFSLSECANTFFNSERPVVLLMTGYYYYPFANMSQNPNHDIFYGVKSTSGSHIVVAYSYRQYNYWRTETKLVWSPVWYNPFRYIEVTEFVNFRTDHYLLVSFGDGTRGMVPINNDYFDNAYGITIS